MKRRDDAIDEDGWTTMTGSLGAGREISVCIGDGEMGFATLRLPDATMSLALLDADDMQGLALLFADAAAKLRAHA